MPHRHHTVTAPADFADVQCPSEASKVSVSSLVPTQRNCTDYWFNANLSGLDVAKTKAYSRIVVFGDGNDGTDLTDARYNMWALPAPWLADKASPIYRHRDGANYAFMDGHVKFLTPDKISNGAVAQSYHTFSPK